MVIVNNLMEKKLYIVGVEFLDKGVRVYGLFGLTETPKLSAYHVFTRDTPEGLAEIIYENYRYPKETTTITPIGKKFLGNPREFPQIGYLDNRVISFFELSDEENNRFINRLTSLTKE